MITKEFYGSLADGREVYRYTLTNKNGLKIKVLNYGGVVTELWTPDRRGGFTDIIGGYDTLESYVGADGYQGALIGRVGNRIDQAKFTLEGKDYELYHTEDNGNLLHGGNIGFNQKIFEVTELDGDEPALVLHTVSEDGDEGFPGNLDLTVTYTLTKENGWKINYHATTDKTTIVNLTHHAYFNLRGYAAGHVYPIKLQLDADTYLPINENLIPTGELRSVEGTPFDFREPKEIGKDINADDKDLIIAGGYDHCFCFTEKGTGNQIVERICVYEPNSGRRMHVLTNQPCVQFYTGNFLTNAEHPFKGGYPQGQQNAFCLETQHMPDSIHHPNFTDVTLSPGEVYDYTTIYRFDIQE